MEEGWLAPAGRGPTRRVVLATLAASIALLLVWGLFATGWLSARGGGSTRRVPIVVGDDGSISIDGTPVDTAQRTRGTTTFLVARATIDTSDDIRPTVTAPPGLRPDHVVVRTQQPWDRSGTARLLVVVGAREVPDPPTLAADPPPLGPIADPFDAAISDQHADHRRLLRLRDGWWWISLLVLLGSVVAPLLLWRRATRRFFSMRLPGPGTELDVAPPSSLDPVGAAVLVAGARPVDEASAFAGHVLDLVERKQLPMRRSTVTPPGLGTLLGLQHADELEDVAVPLLATLADDDGFNVLLPDVPEKVKRLPPEARRAWHEHVAARAAFERVMAVATTRRLAIVAAVAAAAALAATAAWAFVVDYDGSRATALLVAIGTGLLAAVLGAWWRDARRWRIVARQRRTERAQWLAWRAGAAATDGPASDPRNMPVLVATDAPDDAMRSSTLATAVDLGAVTSRTITALRTTFRPD